MPEYLRTTWGCRALYGGESLIIKISFIIDHSFTVNSHNGSLESFEEYFIDKLREFIRENKKVGNNVLFGSYEIASRRGYRNF